MPKWLAESKCDFLEWEYVNLELCSSTKQLISKEELYMTICSFTKSNFN